MLAGEILRRAAGRFPRKTALVFHDSRVDFADLDRAASRFAHALLAAGIEKGDKIAILCGNDSAYAVAHFGAARSGAVLTHLSARATAVDIAWMLDWSESRLLVIGADRATVAAAALVEAKGIETVVTVGDSGAAEISGAIGFDDFIAGQPDTVPDLGLVDTDPQAISFTGGTTGSPKAVVVSHRARYVNNVTGAVEFDIDARDIMVTSTPLFHAAGLFIWFQLGILLGASNVVMRAWNPADFIDTVETHGATAALLVPTQLHDLIADPAFDAGRLKSLRLINYAAAPMPPAVLEAAMAALPDVDFMEHLGQSETGPIVVRRHWDTASRPRSVGRPAFGVETRVVDPEGNPVPTGVIGEVVTRGEHLALEYYRDPEQTAALFRLGDDWLWTGDLATVDEDGFITLVDRSKDMIISGGENIYPKEIENALYQHDAVSECAVFGIPDDRFGEVPAAHVVLRNGAVISEDALLDFCAERVARYKRPRLLKLVAEIPKTPVGKVQKHLIRAPYWEGHEGRI